MEIVQFKIKGMTCDHCAQTIEKVLTAQAGILEKEVSYSEAKGKFVFDPSQISKDKIKEAINATGHYQVVGELENEGDKYKFDLIIIGGGSAAFSAATTAHEKGGRVLIINEGLPIGGTCVNVGCIPSKHLIRVAESIHRASFSNFDGVEFSRPNVNFKQIIQGKRQLVETLRRKKYMDVIKNKEGIQFLKGWASLIDSSSVQVGAFIYKSPRILLASGSGTRIPNIKGIETIDYLNHTSLFELEKLPQSLTVLGAGYIGLEIATAYSRMGAKVRILEFTDRPLRSVTPDISYEIVKHMENEGIEFYPNYRIDKFVKRNDGVDINGKNARTGKEFNFFEEGKIVIATGVKANTSNMGLEELGLKMDDNSKIIVNEKQETNVHGIYAAGDCANTPSFVYTAAAEGRTAALNALDQAGVETSYTGLPWVVFTDPQVAGAGMDEHEAAEKGIPVETSTISLADVPLAIAANDMRGFIKLIRNPDTDALLGIRVVAHEGGELVMQGSLAIKYGIPVQEIANSLFPYLTLSEGIKLAAIGFHKDVSELSCCAV